MVLSSIGILKAQRKRGEKKTLIFYLSKNIWKSVFILRKKNQNFFFFWKSEFHLGRHFDYIKETRTCKSAKTQRLVIIKRLVVSISLSHFPFWKNSHFFLTLSHLQNQKIFPQESGFPYHKNRQIKFKKWTGSKIFPKESDPLSSNGFLILKCLIS